jgi:hypothetical protein
MSIIAYRSSIIDKLKESFPQLNDVSPHPGKFTLEDFDRLSHRSPAAYVAVLGAPAKDKLATGEILFDIHIGVFIATRASRDDAPDVEGWQLAEAIAALAQWNYFNTHSFPADKIEIENLWSTKQDRKAICIMGVAWVSQLKIGTDYVDALMQVQRGQKFVFPSHLVMKGAVYDDADPDLT